MGHPTPPRIHALLTGLAEPLIDAAVTEATALIPRDEAVSETFLLRAERVQGVVLAFQAMLRCPAVDGMSDFDVVMALASVCGTVLAQVNEPRPLYEAFRAQTAAVIKEVAQAVRARASGVQ